MARGLPLGRKIYLLTYVRQVLSHLVPQATTRTLLFLTVAAGLWTRGLLLRHGGVAFAGASALLPLPLRFPSASSRGASSQGALDRLDLALGVLQARLLKVARVCRARDELAVAAQPVLAQRAVRVGDPAAQRRVFVDTLDLHALEDVVVGCGAESGVEGRRGWAAIGARG